MALTPVGRRPHYAVMARLPRFVLPGVPHHITQRGNRRERTFFEDGDYQLYLDMLSDASRRASVGIWSYCLIQPCAHRRRAVRRGWIAPDFSPRPPALYRLH